uniref:CASP-like protein 2U1 n=1 Tax=Osmunda lancea TaxID=90694 RepID=CSPL2_OSMLA|nr:RecName: Full=CASP-like protein 2U1; Short=OlCASPL2U1 [Osmunda lancea]
MVLRIVASLLSIAALVLMAKDKQVVYLNLAGEELTLEAKHSYVEAFVYLVYSNGLVAIYCFLLVFALVFRLIDKAGCGKSAAWIIFLLDQGLAYVLLAAAAASTEVAYVAKRGNNKVGWSEVCSTFGHFCNLVGVSIVITFISVLAMATLSVMSARRLFKTYGPERKQISSNDAPAI